MDGLGRLDWYTATDSESGCRCFVQRLGDGQYAMQFDNDAPVLVTQDELLAQAQLPDGVKDVRWIPFELLRRHVISAHGDMSYVLLARR